MPNKALEEIHLSKANQYIARCEVLVREQEARINQLNENHQDTSEARQFLLLLKRVLQSMHEHRALILRVLNE